MVAKRLFVVFTGYIWFKKDVRVNFLSYVQTALYHNLSWSMRYFYNSMRVLLTPDFCIMLVKNFIGVEQAFIRKQDVIQESDRMYQYSNLRKGVEKYECQN